MSAIMDDDTQILGARDGANLVYAVSSAYQAGSLRVFHNGNLQDRTWVTELNPSAGTFSVEFAPRVGDKLGAFYSDTAPPAPETFVSALTAQIDASTLSAELRPEPCIECGLVPVVVSSGVETAELSCGLDTLELFANLECV